MTLVISDRFIAHRYDRYSSSSSTFHATDLESTISLRGNPVALNGKWCLEMKFWSLEMFFSTG